MRSQIRTLAENVLRRMPVLRATYAELATLRTQLQQAHTIPQPTQPPPAIRRLGSLSAQQLESSVPVINSIEERILMTLRCRDADSIPKVADAGKVVEEPNGQRVQTMHRRLLRRLDARPHRALSGPP